MTEQRIEELVNELTLDEKIGMIHGAGLFRTEGVKRLGIPPLKMSDGPMGVRNEFPDDSWVPYGYSSDYVTYLPSNSALAATWNKELAYEAGKVLGEEARGRGKDVILAPGINIKRSPLCGRNFEYMSEDPYLSGEMGVSVVEGVQTADVAACVKHYAINSQETERLWVDAKVSDRALREIYLPAFKKVVQEGKSYSLMGAYNRYKGVHCCENKVLLNDILRKEWGYDGMVVSDWGAVHKTKEVAEADMDIEMSVTYNFDEYCMAQPLKEAVEKGEVAEELLDKKVRNILRMMGRLHMLDGEERKAGAYDTLEHRQKTLDTARESVVLLKNEKDILPLKANATYQGEPQKILVIGDNANRIHSNGGGSAEIKALYEVSPLLGITKLLGGSAEVTFAQGYIADDMEEQKDDVNWQADSLENGGGSTGEKKDENESLKARQKAAREEAVRLAKEYDTVILIGGQNHLQDLEGHDRPDMKLPYAQDELIEEVLDANPDTIVVIASGSPVEMPWIKKAQTLVWHWYAGMEGGTALAEVLFGKVNPSGRLPETFPVKHTDCSAHCIGEFPGGESVDYKEGIFVGYRYYDTENVSVLFPFGYGLSYTEFEMSDMKAEVLREKRADNEEKSVGREERNADDLMGHLQVKVTVSVENTGDRAGKEVVQIYVGKKDSKIERAAKELCAFAKVELEAGEKKALELTLTSDAFTYYDEEKGDFAVETGTYEIYAGKSVEEVCQKAEVVL